MSMTKVVKVPVVIDEPDEQLREIKYKALYKVMQESRFLGNLAIRYAITFDGLRDIPPGTKDDGSPLHPETAIYRRLAAQCHFLPRASMATLGKRARALFLASNKAAWTGTKSLPTYRSSFLFFRHQGTTLQAVERNGIKQFLIQPSSFGDKWLSEALLVEVNGKAFPLEKNQGKLKLVSCFSWKDQGAAAVVQRIVEGQYKLADSQIHAGKKGLALYLSYSFEPVPPVLDPAKVCGIDLGVVIPAVCAVNFGPQRKSLGDGRTVWDARAKFRAARRREQARLGLYSKTRNWRRSEKEEQWIQSYYHALTRQVVKFCLQNDCGTIHLEDLSSLREKDCKSEFKRLLWVPSKFHELLAYKAAEAEIALVKINPRNTSKRCSECGHISAANRRSQADFVCEKCGDPQKPVKADYNAAKNIALASGDVITKGYIQGSPENTQDGDILGRKRRRRKAVDYASAADFTAGGR